MTGISLDRLQKFVGLVTRDTKLYSDAAYEKEIGVYIRLNYTKVGICG